MLPSCLQATLHRNNPRPSFRFLLLLCSVWLAFTWLPTPIFAIEIEAEGRASIHNKNTASARSQAIRNAQRNAIEQGVGVLINAKAQTQNYEIIRENILTTSEGFITKYTIVSEGAVAGDEYYQVKIKANVSQNLLKQRLSALRILHAQADQPRVMVLYRPVSPNALPRTHNMTQTSLLTMRSALNEAGFRVFDEASTAKVYRGVERAAKIDRPDEALAALALDQQADLLVLQSIVAGKRGAENGLFAAAYATVRARVISATTGRNVANASISAKQLLKPNAGPYDWELGLANAAKKAASQAADKVIGRIANTYKIQKGRGNAFVLVFRGFNDDEKDKIIDFLEGSPGFRQLSERQNTVNLLEVELFSNEKHSRLRREVRLGLRRQGIGLTIQMASRNRVVFSNAKEEQSKP